MNIPTYFVGVIIARHHILGNNDSNTNGRVIANLIRDNKFTHLGPDFKTYLTNRAASTPDIILNSNIHCHNIYIKQGKITTSDHLPIIIQLSGSPIQLPTAPQMDLKHDNWDEFQTELAQNTFENMDGKIKTAINSEMHSWFGLLQKAMDNHIPIRHYCTIPHPNIMPELTALKEEFRQLQLTARNG